MTIAELVAKWRAEAFEFDEIGQRHLAAVIRRHVRELEAMGNG
jgi:hypothetical protein